MTAVRLAHERSGPRGAPVVVLTGSVGTNLSVWDAQARVLARRFDVVRCDLRGHGASPVPPGPYAIPELGGDLLALLDHLAIDRAALVGLSIGAMISIWAAAHAPGRTERLVACCTTARFGPDVAAAYQERAARVRAEGMAAIAGGVLERWFTPEFAIHRPATVQRIREAFIATPAEGYAGCCEALAALDLEPELGRVTAPTLVLAGERDPATPPAHGQAVADGIAGARFDLLADCAHLASIERAELLTALLLRFLQPETTKETRHE